MKYLRYFSAILLGCLISSFSSPVFSEPLPKSFDHAIAPITSPKSLTLFLKKEFEFREDEDLFGQEDRWQAPEEFWQKKSGDCEDYALFARYVLRKLGYEAQVVSFYDEFGNGHTVALFQENGTYNVIDGDRLLAYETKTIEESLTQLYPSWTWGAIADQRGSRGWMLQRLSNLNGGAAL